MRVLQLVKTADGATWAAEQATELVKMGVEVHVAIPRLQGRTIPRWERSGAILHDTPCDLQPRRLSSAPSDLKRLRSLVERIQPDLVHSHFVSSTLMMRWALGKGSKVPRIFQVPGPLHLEHAFWKRLEIGSAGAQDVWIASSQCIRNHYTLAGISADRVYLSYYGFGVNGFQHPRSGALRQKLGLTDDVTIVGNASYIYPPKRYLGQNRGLKSHEDIIDALGMVLQKRADVVGVLIGGTFRGSHRYEQQLRERAQRVGAGRIVMTGFLPHQEVAQCMPDFDLAVHVPMSENCGGVVEPMLAGVATIAGDVGGLPEVVIDGVTGRVVPIRNPERLAKTILELLDSPERTAMARAGSALVREMFNVERTAREVYDIYRHLLRQTAQRPETFDAKRFLAAQPELAKA